jgi:hypothetical protein
MIGCSACINDGVSARVGKTLFQKKVLNHRGSNLGKLEVAELWKEIAGQMTPLLGNGLPL